MYLVFSFNTCENITINYRRCFYMEKNLLSAPEVAKILGLVQKKYDVIS